MRILQMSIQAGVLVVAIVVIRAIALNKLPKGAFLVLWGVALVRLLVPFSFSSQFSIYTFVDDALGRATASMAPTPGTAAPPVNPAIGGAEVLGTPTQAIGQQAVSIDPVMLVWIIGMVAALTFFAVVYWRNCRELRFALIIRGNGLIDEWRKGHKLLRPLTVLQSDRLTTPITVGFLRPRIILPKAMDMKDEQLLRYVLTHEYYHIRRFDAVWKLLIVFALCVHWFNPLVWVMAILINRDLEITCDEMVVRHFGADTKRAYAYSLISMAEQRSKLAPLFSGFSKNAAEERITAIMKIQKTSFVGIILALVLVLGATTVFATSALAEPPMPDTITQSEQVTGSAYERVQFMYTDDDIKMTYGIDMDTFEGRISPDGGTTWYTNNFIDTKTGLMHTFSPTDGRKVSPNKGQNWYDDFVQEGDYIICSMSIEDNSQRSTHNTAISEDGGKTWTYSADTNEWFTYEEYKAYVEQTIAMMQADVDAGETYLDSQGNPYKVTQEMVDSLQAEFTENLALLKEGKTQIARDLLFQRSVPSQEEIEGGQAREHTLMVDILGETVTFGPYDTREEAFSALEIYCNGLIAQNKMTDADYQKILDELA